MIFFCLGKGKCFPHKPSKSLAQRIVPALNVLGFSSFLAHTLVILSKDIFIRLPKVTHRLHMAVHL